MYKIVKKRQLNDMVTLMEVEAPFVAKKAEAGQFIIFRVDEFGERIPLTIADYDREKGTVTIIFQAVGRSTKLLAELNEGDSIHDFVGPLGKPTELDGYKKAVLDVLLLILQPKLFSTRVLKWTSSQVSGARILLFWKMR